MPGEAPVELRVDELVASVVELASGRAAGPRQRDRASRDAPAVTLPRAALLQVAQNLLRNALDAVERPRDACRSSFATATFAVRVEDAGPGMTPDVLARVGEPFFSTKRPGQGLGLGVFIARTLARADGRAAHLRVEPGPRHDGARRDSRASAR